MARGDSKRPEASREGHSEVFLNRDRDEELPEDRRGGLLLHCAVSYSSPVFCQTRLCLLLLHTNHRICPTTVTMGHSSCYTLPSLYERVIFTYFITEEKHYYEAPQACHEVNRKKRRSCAMFTVLAWQHKKPDMQGVDKICASDNKQQLFWLVCMNNCTVCLVPSR